MQSVALIIIVVILFIGLAVLSIIYCLRSLEKERAKFSAHATFHTIILGMQQASTHAELDFWGNEASLLLKIYHKKVPEILLNTLATELAAAIRIRTTEGFTK